MGLDSTKTLQVVQLPIAPQECGISMPFLSATSNTDSSRVNSQRLSSGKWMDLVVMASMADYVGGYDFVMRFVAFDLETTGTLPGVDRIVRSGRRALRQW